MKTRLSISGMHCASCVSKVESALAGVEGVTRVSVSLASGDALIEYDPARAAPGNAINDALIQAVVSAGYGASLPGSKTEPERDLRELKLQVIVGLLLSLATLILGALGASNWILLACSAPVQFWCGASFLRGFFRSILKLEATMDTLVGLGTLSAWGYSAAVTLLSTLKGTSWGSHDVYFEIAAFLITFVLLGRFLESRARARTQTAIQKLISLLPPQAHVLRQGKFLELPLSDVFAGDVLLVKPGERIPVDGLVVSGSSSIDESTLTGESIPVERGPNQSVSAGTLNTTGSFEMRATRIGEATLLSRIIETVRRAQASKAPIQRYADLVSSYFVPVVIALAILTFAAWMILTRSAGASLLSAISVLIISCPCALGLATPVAVMVAMGKATEKGILIRDAEALETLGQTRVMIFDKTGTLTLGKPELSRVHPLAASENEALLWAASAENASEHLLARAIVEAAEKREIPLRKIERFKSFPGGGIEARIDGKNVRVGSLQFLGAPESIVSPDPAHPANPASTWIAATADDKLLATFEILDPPRPDARAVLKRIRALGIRPFLISGDHPATARFIGESLGFSSDEIFGGVSPTEKADRVAALRASRRASSRALGRFSDDTTPVPSVVTMIGDGVNDAPALARADVGIAMGSGADVAIESASVTLLHPSLESIPQAYLLSRRTMRTIRQNLFASFFYNALGIPIAAGVLYPWTGWKLNPMIAGAAMALSSVSVVLNSLRLKRWDWTDDGETGGKC